jgi:hypothetical protein
MPHKIEPSPTGRASCRGCKHGIEKGALRFAEEFRNPYSDEGGMSFRYWHLNCAAVKLANELGVALAAFDGPIDDRASLEALVHAHTRPEMPFAERAESGRARCRACDVPLKKGELRIAFERVYESPMGAQKGAAYAHPECVSRYLERESERGGASRDCDDAIGRILANSPLATHDLDELRRRLALQGQPPPPPQG